MIKIQCMCILWFKIHMMGIVNDKMTDKGGLNTHPVYLLGMATINRLPG